MPDIDILGVINLGLMPFMLYMAWVFWVALQRANEKHNDLMERLMEVIQYNTKAITENELRSQLVCSKVVEHDDRVASIDDKIDMIGSTTQKIDVRTVRIEELLKQRPVGKMEKEL